MTKSKFIRIILSICLLGWLLAQVEHESLRLYLLNAEYSWYFASIAILPLAMWCGAYKWQILMANRGLRVGGILLISKFLIGVFFNNFLPSNVGGDIVRASLLTRHVGSEHWKIVWGSMLVERFTGLTGLFIALVIGAIFNFDWFVSLNITYPLLLALIAFASIILVVFSNIQPIPTFLVARAPSLEKPVRLLQQLRDCMREFRNHRIILSKCVGISVFFYFLKALQLWLIIKMFPPVSADLTAMLVAFTVTSLISMVPISFNGYGIQEVGYTFILNSLGYSITQALAIALLFRSLSIALSVIGGFLFATSDLSRQAIEKSIDIFPL